MNKIGEYAKAIEDYNMALENDKHLTSPIRKQSIASVNKSTEENKENSIPTELLSLQSFTKTEDAVQS